MSFPTKAKRELCWNTRDSYWHCLELNNEDKEKCLKMRQEYEKNCSQQWVKHFDRRRQYEKFKKQMEAVDWQDPIDNRKRKT